MIVIYLDLDATADQEAWFETAVECAAFIAHRLAGTGHRVRRDLDRRSSRSAWGTSITCPGGFMSASPQGASCKSGLGAGNSTRRT